MKKLSLTVVDDGELVKVTYFVVNNDGSITIAWDRRMSHVEVEELVKGLINNLRGGKV